MSLLDRIAEIRVFDPAGYVPLVVDGAEMGLIEKGFATILARFPETFRFDGGAVRLADGLSGFDARTAAVDSALRALRDEGHFPNWREERWPVAAAFGEKPAFDIERAAVARLGVRGYGVHLNGYVGRGKDMRMWIARRAMDRALDPGKLDQIVAGGQPSGLGLRENLVKECGEEAAIPPDLVARAVAVGAISYCTTRAEGLRRDVEFVYDLELPDDFVPTNTDGEVGGFEMWPIDKVAETVAGSDAFKFNCALVVIDFLIRHGFIEPDHPDYVALIHGLHGL